MLDSMSKTELSKLVHDGYQRVNLERRNAAFSFCRDNGLKKPGISPTSNARLSGSSD